MQAKDRTIKDGYIKYAIGPITFMIPANPEFSTNILIRIVNIKAIR